LNDASVLKLISAALIAPRRRRHGMSARRHDRRRAPSWDFAFTFPSLAGLGRFPWPSRGCAWPCAASA